MPSKFEDLKQLIVDRIRAGDYPVGSRLPGLRGLAEEFGVHANTVARVYGELAEAGWLRSEQGRGTFVIDVPDSGHVGEATDQIFAALCELASRGRRLGLSRREWARMADEAEANGFASAGPALWFVECHPSDVDDMTVSLGALLQLSVGGLLVDELPHHLMRHPDTDQLFVTTRFHIDEVEAAAAGRHPVVLVGVSPTSDTLVRLARLRPEMRLAVVASNARTVDNLSRMLHAFARLVPEVGLTADDPAAPDAVRGMDVVLTSQSVHQRVLSWGAKAEVMATRYQIEPTSVAYLREVLRQRQQTPLVAGAD